MNDQYFPPAGSFIDLSDYSSNLRTLTLGDGLLECSTCGSGTGTIDVTFKKSNAVYRYYHIPPTLWNFLLRGKKIMDDVEEFSIGRAFHLEVIKKADIYHYERIS